MRRHPSGSRTVRARAGMTLTELLACMVLFSMISLLFWDLFRQVWQIQVACQARLARTAEVADLSRVLARAVHRATAARVERKGAGESWLGLTVPEGVVWFGRVEDRLVEQSERAEGTGEMLRVREVEEVRFLVGGEAGGGFAVRVKLRLRDGVVTHMRGNTVDLTFVSRQEGGR